MAEMFLYLDGVQGESLDFAHGQEIEIIDWSWTTENKVRWDLNQGGQSTKVEVKQITLHKICDKASVVLYQNCVTGKHIKSAKITCRKNDGDAKVEYLILELTDLMISKVEFNGDGNDQSLKETLELSFAEFKLHYKIQRDEGSPGGDVSFGFHIQKQQKT